MTYDIENFKEDMYKELLKGYDPCRIAKEAWTIYFDDPSNLEEGLKSQIMKVIVMEEGEEFQMTEAEFKDFLDKL